MTTRSHRRLATVLVTLLALATTGAESPALARKRPKPKTLPASFTQYPASERGGREYWLYLPTRKATERIPLVVYLHGCQQTAAEAAAQTRFNQLAERLRFAVAYPQQNVTPGSSAPFVDGNGIGCWNWFLTEHQRRDAGEPKAIAAITRHVVATHGIDPSRVYVEGISAGGDMAVIMGATYPDLYAAAGAIAACPYATCTDTTGALAYRAMGQHARVVPIFVVQGTADTLNVFPLGASLVQQWLGTADLADDGSAQGSVSRLPAKTETYEANQSPRPGTGDLCIRSANWPCPGGAVGFQESYPYTVQTYASRGCELAEFWAIHGLEHAYPNADPSTKFSDPLGPDITTAAYEFFAEHTLAGPCTGR